MGTILIVEDDPINLRVFAKILIKLGNFEVKSTENVESVLNFAKNRDIDLILMDVSLSHSFYQGKSMDGVGITQLLKSHPDTATIPVILVTAHAMAGDHERFIQKSGADSYISKPVVDHESFIKHIQQLIDKG